MSTVNDQLFQEVRRNAGYAAFAAFCLLYFGFFRFAIPTVTNLFNYGEIIVDYAMRVGGIALAVIAVWSLSGHFLAILIDGFCSSLIGAAFVIGGAIMLIGGGDFVSSGLYLVFGGLFVSAGIRNVQWYKMAAATTAKNKGSATQVLKAPHTDSTGASGRGHADDERSYSGQSADGPVPTGLTQGTLSKSTCENKETADEVVAPPEDHVSHDVGYLAGLGKAPPPRQF